MTQLVTQDRPHVAPVARRLFRAAAQTPLSPGKHERDRKRLFALIAAYADGGRHDPSITELARRLGSAWNRHKRARRIDKLLRDLERDGLLSPVGATRASVSGTATSWYSAGEGAMSDPLSVVWDALDRAGCRPFGPGHQFTACCPAHDDRQPSLSIGVGADGGP
jgi:hypothetical protein